MKVEITIPDGATVGTVVAGTVTETGGSTPPGPTGPTAPPGPTGPTNPPPTNGWTPPGNAIILGTLTPNTGNKQATLAQLGVMYAIQLTADARDAGFSCPSGTCTAGINGNYSAQGMDAAVVFGQLKAGDWLIVFLGLDSGGGNWGKHNVPASALFSAHA